MEEKPSKLEALKEERFRPDTREERIAKALAALKSPPVLHLTADQWKDAAESQDLEEEE